jgi:hypothetical protein
MHDLTPEDRILTTLPLFHVGGLNNLTTPALQAGCTVVLAGGIAGEPGSGPHMVHPLRCKAIASARLKNDEVAGDLGVAAAGRTCCRSAGSPRRSSSARCCGTGPAWSGWG